jgi:la-related protein 1
MDSKGWVPVSLIASFNRVRQFTPDVTIVKEMLSLSTMVQVKDDWVRMIGWEIFVLPDAAASVVDEGQDFPHSGPVAQNDVNGIVDGEQLRPVLPSSDAHGGDGVTMDRRGEGEDEEDEDDVEIVMNSDAGPTRLWSASRPT